MSVQHEAWKRAEVEAWQAQESAILAERSQLEAAYHQQVIPAHAHKHEGHTSY